MCWDELAEKNLKLLFEYFDNLYIIISSTWRLGYPDNMRWKALENNFHSMGLIDKLIGMTGRSESAWREHEIQDYLSKTQNNIESFAVIDDDIVDLRTFEDTKLVKVESNIGLSSFDVEKCLKILGYNFNDNP